MGAAAASEAVVVDPLVVVIVLVVEVAALVVVDADSVGDALLVAAGQEEQAAQTDQVEWEDRQVSVESAIQEAQEAQVGHDIVDLTLHIEAIAAIGIEDVTATTVADSMDTTGVALVGAGGDTIHSGGDLLRCHSQRQSGGIGHVNGSTTIMTTQ